MRGFTILVAPIIAIGWGIVSGPGVISGPGVPPGRMDSGFDRAGRPVHCFIPFLSQIMGALEPIGTSQPTPKKDVAPANTPTKTVPAAPAAQPDAKEAAAKFEKRLTAVDEKMAAVADLRADFEQKKKTTLLKKPLVSKGTLVCKGETVLWRTTTPRKSDMLVGDGKVTVYYPDDNLAEVYSVGSQFREASGGPLPRLSKLKENFEFAEMDAKEVLASGEKLDLTNRIAVKLTPKTDELKKHVASVRVLIDESIPCADRIVIVDPEGDETELRFTAVKINTGMKDTELELKLPEKTKVSTPTGASK